MKFKSTKRFIRYLFENTEQNNNAILALSAKKFFTTDEGKSLIESFEEFYGKNSQELQNVFLKIKNSIKNETKNINKKEYEEKIPKEVSVLAADTAEFISEQNYNMNEMNEEEKNIFDYLLQYLRDSSIIGIKSPKKYSGPPHSNPPHSGEDPFGPIPTPFSALGHYFRRGGKAAGRPPGFFSESKFDLNRWQKLAGIKILKG